MGWCTMALQGGLVGKCLSRHLASVEWENVVQNWATDKQAWQQQLPETMPVEVARATCPALLAASFFGFPILAGPPQAQKIGRVSDTSLWLGFFVNSWASGLEARVCVFGSFVGG